MAIIPILLGPIWSGNLTKVAPACRCKSQIQKSTPIAIRTKFWKKETMEDTKRKVKGSRFRFEIEGLCLRYFRISSF